MSTRIRAGRPLYIAMDVVRELSVDVSGSMDFFSEEATVPLDELPACVGMFRVFTSKKEALKYSKTVVKVTT